MLPHYWPRRRVEKKSRMENHRKIEITDRHVWSGVKEKSIAEWKEDSHESEIQTDMPGVGVEKNSAHRKFM